MSLPILPLRPILSRYWYWDLDWYRYYVITDADTIIETGAEVNNETKLDTDIEAVTWFWDWSEQLSLCQYSMTGLSNSFLNLLEGKCCYWENSAVSEAPRRRILKIKLRWPRFWDFNVGNSPFFLNLDDSGSELWEFRLYGAPKTHYFLKFSASEHCLWEIRWEAPTLLAGFFDYMILAASLLHMKFNIIPHMR